MRDEYRNVDSVMAFKNVLSRDVTASAPSVIKFANMLVEARSNPNYNVCNYCICTRYVSI